MIRQIHDFLVFLTMLTQMACMLSYPSSLNLILNLRDYSMFVIKIFVLIFYNRIWFSVWIYSIYLIELAKQNRFVQQHASQRKS